MPFIIFMFVFDSTLETGFYFYLPMPRTNRFLGMGLQAAAAGLWSVDRGRLGRTGVVTKEIDRRVRRHYSGKRSTGFRSNPTLANPLH